MNSVNTVCEPPATHRLESVTLKDDASEGYSSMTTTSSDLLAEIRYNIDEVFIKLTSWSHCKGSKLSIFKNWKRDLGLKWVHLNQSW